MNIPELIDPLLLPALDLPDELGELIRTNPAAARKVLNDMGAAAQESAPPTSVKIFERTIPGPDTDIPLVIYEPPVAGPRPALLWIHGGGYMLGSAHDDGMCIPMAEAVGCTIVSVEYRLAPEHPFPAGPEDCYSALVWLSEHAEELGIDPTRIAIGGASAGGGMAAGVALMNRDRVGIPLVLQLLLYPMVDDRHDTPSGHSITYEKVWNRDISLYAWGLYLGDSQGEQVSPYAAASRASNVDGLPPTYLCVGTLDLFRDENIDYCQRLMDANVPTELAVYPGVTHGAESFVPDAPVSKRMVSDYIDALKRALGV